MGGIGVSLQQGLESNKHIRIEDEAIWVVESNLNHSVFVLEYGASQGTLTSVVNTIWVGSVLNQ